MVTLYDLISPTYEVDLVNVISHIWCWITAMNIAILVFGRYHLVSLEPEATRKAGATFY